MSRKQYWTAPILALVLAAAVAASEPTPCRPVPPPAPAYASEPAPIAYTVPRMEPVRPVCCPEPKGYRINLRLTDSKGDVLCRPEMYVLEGQFARCEMASPCEDRKGCVAARGFKVCVNGSKDNRPTLEAEAYVAERSEGKGTAVCREHKVGWTTRVKLGETKKLRCEHLEGKKLVQTYLEVTVSEWDRTQAVACPPTAPCPTPCRPCPPMACPAPVPSTPMIPVTQAVYTTGATLPRPPGCNGTTLIAVKRCGDEKCLEIDCNGAASLCLVKAELWLPGCEKLHLSVEDKRVYLNTPSFEALAERVRTGPSGELVLDGEVRICSDQVGDIQADRVTVTFKNGTPEFILRGSKD
jgi:hypothetical protein